MQAPPLLQKILAHKISDVILRILKERFGTIPRDVTGRLQEVLDEEKLTILTLLAAKCPDLATFRKALPRKRATKPSAKRTRSP